MGVSAPVAAFSSNGKIKLLSAITAYPIRPDGRKAMSLTGTRVGNGLPGTAVSAPVSGCVR
ncbi:hypothetical protein D3C86_2179760 [compost metagenome]